MALGGYSTLVLEGSILPSRELGQRWAFGCCYDDSNKPPLAVWLGGGPLKRKVEDDTESLDEALSK